MTDHRDNPELDEIQLLLPWYAAGTLQPADKARVEAALATDPALRASLSRIEEEREEDVQLNQSLPPPRSAQLDALMRRIESDAPRRDRSVASRPRRATRCDLCIDDAANRGVHRRRSGLCDRGRKWRHPQPRFTSGDRPGSYVTASVEPAAPGDQALILVAFTAGASIDAVTDLLRNEKAGNRRWPQGREPLPAVRCCRGARHRHCRLARPPRHHPVCRSQPIARRRMPMTHHQKSLPLSLFASLLIAGVGAPVLGAGVDIDIDMGNPLEMLTNSNPSPAPAPAKPKPPAKKTVAMLPAVSETRPLSRMRFWSRPRST